MRKSRFLLVLIVLLSVSSLLLAGCSENISTQSKNSLPMASMDDMPAEVQAAPQVVQQAYQFAAANPEVMQQIPCYCGCGAMGHTSNYACYVSNVGADTDHPASGEITFDTHALGCSICVDITQDTMRLLEQGKTVSEIKVYIDQTYAKYGPSNMP